MSLINFEITEHVQLKKILTLNISLRNEEDEFKMLIEKRSIQLEKLYDKYEANERELEKLHAAHYKSLREEIQQRSKVLKETISELEHELIAKLDSSDQRRQKIKISSRPYKSKEEFCKVMQKFKEPSIAYRTKIENELEKRTEELNVTNDEMSAIKCALNKFGLTEFKYDKRVLKHFLGKLKNDSVSVKSDPSLTNNPNNTNVQRTPLRPPIIDIYPAVAVVVDDDIQILDAEDTFLNEENTSIDPTINNNTNNDQSEAMDSQALTPNTSTAASDVEVSVMSAAAAAVARRKLKSKRKSRLRFSADDKKALEVQFERSHFKVPDVKTISDIALQLDTTEVRVTNWFKNRRYKNLKIMTLKTAKIKRRLSIVTSQLTLPIRPIIIERRKFTRKTEVQLEILKHSFYINQSPSLQERIELVEKTKLTIECITNWFANTKRKQNKKK
jgi:hypothetical protein